MTKIALLVGVSEYGTSFSLLPAVLANVTALQQVLSNVGGFTEVKTLVNPDPKMMAAALETLIAARQPDDLVLLYFAGRGYQDEDGKLYLTSSYQNQSALVNSSAIPATMLQQFLNASRAQQLVILDCCWSSTLSAGNWWVDIGGPIGAVGRVILTATTTKSGYFHDTSGLSVYTYYLVEGLATGAADLDQDGAILIAELHEYSQRKVQTVAPVMQPHMYGTAQQVILAETAIAPPLLHYLQAAEAYVERGKFSIVGRSMLDVLRQSLEIEAEVAEAIEAQVLQPGREYQRKLQRYVQEMVEAMRGGGGWSQAVRSRCQQQQQVLGLRDADVAALTEQIAGEFSSSPTVMLPLTGANGNYLNSICPQLVLSHKNLWLLVGVGIGMSLTAATGVLSAYMQLNGIRNSQIEAKYEECSTKAEIKSWAAETFFHKDVQSLLNACRLQQAEMLAADNKFSSAIKTAKKIPRNSSFYPQAQQFIKEWSEI